MNKGFKKYLLEETGATDCHETDIIQSLWSGYGKISRYRLLDSSTETVVIKSISLDPVDHHPRGWNTDFSHQRKVRSYQVETHWYKEWSQLCSSECRVPECLGTFVDGLEQWIILEDLDYYYPLRKDQVDLQDVHLCLNWLAHFHASFLGQQPKSIWKIGTYWNLETRPEELEQMQHQKLKSKAALIDSLLNDCKYQTIVHGDAKLANFCFARDSTRVAAVDFQYVGGGCGMKDVAYFLGSCLSSEECEYYEKALLDHYFAQLYIALNKSDNQTHFNEIEKEWREMYPLACVDFTRFLLGWMPSHQKVNDYNMKKVQDVLSVI